MAGNHISSDLDSDSVVDSGFVVDFVLEVAGSHYDCYSALDLAVCVHYCSDSETLLLHLYHHSADPVVVVVAVVVLAAAAAAAGAAHLPVAYVVDVEVVVVVAAAYLAAASVFVAAAPKELLPKLRLSVAGL